MRKVLFLFLLLTQTAIAAKKTFTVSNGHLTDPEGFPFIARGMNVPSAYFLNKSLTALESIKAYGFNSIRIVWCAEGLIVPGRCDNKDIHSPENLVFILKKAKALRLVVTLNFQNATGSDSRDDLMKVVDYITSEKIRPILQKHQDNLLINIANEWHGSWADSNQEGRVWHNAYKDAIKRIREKNITTPLLIDTCGWGQDPTCVFNYGPSLMSEDSNIMFSLHAYEYLLQSESKLNRIFEKMKKLKLPFIIGEFATEHYGNYVAWEHLLKVSHDEKIGRFIWSYFGNSNDLSALNFVADDDFTSLTQSGQLLYEHPFGLRSDSVEARHYE